MSYKVGCCQFYPQLMDVRGNLEIMEELLKDVKADLIVLPELAASGYVFNSKEEVGKVAEDGSSGPSAKLFKQLSRDNNTTYVLGYCENAGGKYYNSVMMVNPDGQVFNYRKTHLFYEEKFWFQPGDTGLNVFEAKGGVKVGLMLCYDWVFPEAARTLALKGAQVIAHPSNLVLPWCQQAMLTRSLENHVFTITGNRVGLEKNGDKELFFTGGSQVVSTKGEPLHRMGKEEEGVCIIEIDPNQALDKAITEHNHVFNDRNPDFYH